MIGLVVMESETTHKLYQKWSTNIQDFSPTANNAAGRLYDVNDDL
jgi:hypothetical protein